MEGAEASSCQATASEPEGFGEDLHRRVGQDLCKPVEKLQQNSVLANKGFSTKYYVLLFYGSNTYFMWKYDNKYIKFVRCCYSGFFGDILPLSVKMYLWLKLYTVPFFVSGQTYKIGKESNNYCSHCMYFLPVSGLKFLSPRFCSLYPFVATVVYSVCIFTCVSHVSC